MKKDDSPPKDYGAAALALTQAAANAIDRIFGGAADELGRGLATRIQVWRWENATKLRDRVAAKCKERGIAPPDDPLPPRIAVPLIDGATGVDDDYMRERWANLLTNAMTPAKAGMVTPLLIRILSEIEPVHARVLDRVHALSWGDKRELTRRGFTVPEISDGLGLDFVETESAIFGLQRQCVVERMMPSIIGDLNLKGTPLARFRITILGDELLEACR